MINIIAIIIFLFGLSTIFTGYLVLFSKADLSLPNDWRTRMAPWIFAKAKRPANKFERIFFGSGYLVLGIMFLYLSWYFKTNLKF